MLPGRSVRPGEVELRSSMPRSKTPKRYNVASSSMVKADNRHLIYSKENLERLLSRTALVRTSYCSLRKQLGEW